MDSTCCHNRVDFVANTSAVAACIAYAVEGYNKDQDCDKMNQIEVVLVLLPLSDPSRRSP